MEKAENHSSATSSRRNYCIHDPPGYIIPSLQDFLLTDITAEKLRDVGGTLRVPYLSIAESFPGAFPGSGVMYGLNNRLMVNLACRQQKENSIPINIIFLIITGSPVSYLSEMAMTALTGKPGNIVHQLPVVVHSDIVISCHLSPQDKHFADLNVLGMDFMSRNHRSLAMNYEAKTFDLIM